MLRRNNELEFEPTGQRRLLALDSVATAAVEISPPKPREIRTVRELPMPLEEARRIALGHETATLGNPSKMPGRAFTLPAEACIRGSELAKNPDSICAHCFGKTAFYSERDYVIAAHRRHLECLDHPQWVEAMITLILYHHDHDGDDYFRWHDVGDLQSVTHLVRIIRVCDKTPEVKHWLPTHEPEMILDYLERVSRDRLHDPIPSNLCIRISADLIGKRPEVIKGLEHLPTSTTHRGHGRGRPVKVPGQTKAFECPSYQNATSGAHGAVGECGTCRACWNAAVKNVSYPVHGYDARKHQVQLPLFEERQ